METSFGAGLFYVLCLHFGRCDGVLADRETHEQTAESRKGCRKGLRAAEKICGKPGEVLKNATLNLPEGKMTFDAVLMDKRGVYLVRTYGWELRYTELRTEQWRREDAKRKEEFENPLLNLKKGVEEIGKIMEENGVHNLKVMPMVVLQITTRLRNCISDMVLIPRLIRN